MAGDRCSAELRQTGKPVWLGQPFADASHLAFVEGDIADQIAILKLIGRLRMELLEAE